MFWIASRKKNILHNYWHNDNFLGAKYDSGGHLRSRHTLVDIHSNIVRGNDYPRSLVWEKISILVHADEEKNIYLNSELLFE